SSDLSSTRLRSIRGRDIYCRGARRIASAHHRHIHMALSFVRHSRLSELIFRWELDQRGRGCGCRLQRAEQPVLLTGGPGREIEGIHITPGTAVTELERPEFINGNWRS